MAMDGGKGGSILGWQYTDLTTPLRWWSFQVWGQPSEEILWRLDQIPNGYQEAMLQKLIVQSTENRAFCLIDWQEEIS